ncbi:MAG: leucine-rich repeat domain-containing protein [Capnocytophaga sp.]|nr:leucine-rich repeat domain-containing protein [Capnocytophaga sp.]
MKHILLGIVTILLLSITTSCSKEVTEKITVKRGAQIYMQAGEPAFDLGSIGDFCIDKETGLLYGPKTALGWGENPISLVDNAHIGESNTIHTGNGQPARTKGNIGDLYLDVSANPTRLYGPKKIEGWPTNYFTLGNQSNLLGANDEPNYVLTDDDKTLAAWVNTRTVYLDMRLDSKLAKLTAIGEDAFRNQSPKITYSEYFILKNIILSETIETIGKRAFQGLHYLETITLSRELKEIGRGIFTGCVRLKQVNIGRKVEYIGEFAFSRLPLETLDLPRSVKVIDRDAFNGISIKKLVLPEGLVKLGSNAFAHCKNLTWVELPESLQVMGNDYPFNNTPNVETLVLHSKYVPNWHPSNLAPFAKATIYVPDESLEDYKASAWSYYVKDRLKPMSELPAEK